MYNKKACLILLASLFITTLFGCGGGGGSSASLDSSTSSSSQTGEGATTTSDGTVTTEVRAVTLAWDAPTTNTDGSSLNPATDLSMYKIYYGTASLMYTTVVNVTNPGTATISKTLNLSPGTYYFSVTTVDISGQESGHSNEVMKTI